MKICFLTHSLNPTIGIGVFSRNFINTLAKERPDWIIDVVVEHSVGHAREKKIIRMGLRDFPRAFGEIRSLSRRYDVVHALDGFPYGVLAILATRGLGKKVYITMVGSGAMVMLVNRFTRPVVSWCYRRADAVFAISAYTAGKVREYVVGLSITPATLGVSREEFESPESDTGALREILSKKPFLLVVGTFKYRKGLMEVVQGYAEAVKTTPELNCVLEGDFHNEYGENIRRFVREHGLEHRVFFLGRVAKNTLRMLYRQALLFSLLPQDVPGNHDIEGFGLVFLEAAAAGLPIVGSTEGPTPEAVNEGNNAILVDPHDISSIGKTIAHIASDSALRMSMSRASREFARHMSWERMVNIYMPYYDTINSYPKSRS